MTSTPPTDETTGLLTPPEANRGRATWVISALGLVVVVALGAGALAITGEDSTDIIPIDDTCPEPIIYDGRPGDPGIQGIGNWVIARHPIPKGTTWTQATEQRLIQFIEVSDLDPVEAWAPEGSLNVEGIAPNAVASCDIPQDAILVQSQWQDRHPTTTIDPTAIATWGTDYCDTSLDLLRVLDAAVVRFDEGDARGAFADVEEAADATISALARIDAPPEEDTADAFESFAGGTRSLLIFAAEPYPGEADMWSQIERLRGDLRFVTRQLAEDMQAVIDGAETPNCSALRAEIARMYD